MSFIFDLIERGLKAHPSVAADPVATAESAITAGAPVLAAIENVVAGKATAADAVTIVNAILEGVAFVDPAAAPVVTLVIDLEPIAETLIASGMVRPGAPGEGQTDIGRGG